jgi:fibronectin-binding autotransporter adhesin
MLIRGAKIGAAVRRALPRLDCRGAGNRVALFVCGGGLYFAFAIGPAAAQLVPGSNAITTSMTLSGTINGNNGPGYFVANGGTLTINNGLLENFTTTGGSGSNGGGGGLGAGGAIFIDTGGTVVLNGTSFSHDTAVGGIGGTPSTFTASGSTPGSGGVLNNGIVNGYFTAVGNGPTGTTPPAAQDNDQVFGGGTGNGFNGGTGTGGGGGVSGFGGIGGAGQVGTPGWSINPYAILNLALATEAVTIAGINTGSAYLAVTGSVDLAAGLLAGSVIDPPLSDAAAAAAITGVAEGLLVTSVVLADAQAAQSLAQAVAVLTSWEQACNDGTLCIGGNGGNGGTGGAGSYAFGGGAGGNGAVGGAAGSSGASEGNSGNGGVGGAGGFGGGGGAGGYGISNTGDSNQGLPGVGGAGGAAGFGGGVGSVGGVISVNTPSGCGGVGVGNGGTAGSGPDCSTGTGTGGAASALSGGGGGDGYGGAIFVNAGATLVITGNATFSGGDAYGGISENGGVAGNGAGTDLFMMSGANVTIAPGLGNIITFNGTIADNSISSIGASNSVGNGASLTIGAGLTVFNGANTYSGQTTIVGGSVGSALQAQDGIGLPTNSLLNFAGTGLYSGGVLEMNGLFSRWVGVFNPPYGNEGGADRVEWTGSGGFAANGGALTVTLDAGGALAWGSGDFVPFGSSLIFGAVNSTNEATFTNAVDISGGTASIVVVNNGTPAGSDALMSGVISSGNSTGNLSVNGGGYNGVLNLSAINTYTGSTTINSGTLGLVGTGSIATSSNIIDNGTFDISQTTAGTSITTLSGSGTVALGSQTLTITTGSTTFSGSITDGGIAGGIGGGVTISGGTQTLSGINTYTGLTTINSGTTLALAGIGSIANSSGVADNGIFDISQTTLGAIITTLSGGGQALIGSKILVISNGSTTFSGDINDGGLGGGTGGSLVVAGGTQTLTGVNTYTGATVVDLGATLALKGVGSIATSDIVDDLGTFDISQTTAGASITTLFGTGSVALGAQALTITAGSTTFAGVIADSGIGGGTGGQFTISGGTQTLSGTNTYTGITTTDPGATLALIGTGSIATSSDVVDNGIFDISQTLGASIVTLSGSGLASLGSQTLTITNGSTTFNGDINDGGIVGGTGGRLTISGGTQTLGGTNTYTGQTTIDLGATLALIGTGSIATSAAVDAIGTFDISQTTAGASITTLVGTGRVSLGDRELTITNGSTTFSGVLADGGIGGGTGGSLIVSGGVQTLSGTNTYTGDTTIAPNPITGAAILALTGTGSIATSSVVQIATNGIFDISQTSVGAAIMTLADTAPGQAGTVLLGSQTLTITNGSTTFSGDINDGGLGGGVGGNLTVSGGTQTLAGVNTYTGLTTIAPNPSTGTATLALAGNGSIATSSEVLVASNGTFDISATTAGASIVTLSGSGSVVLGSQVLTLTAAAAGPAGINPAGIFSGVISGLGGMAITGGHEELTGTNSYFGGTTVTNGATLSINNSSSLGNMASTLTLNNGTLVVDGSITIPQPITLLGAPPGLDLLNLNSFNVTLSGAISGPGVLTALNGGTLNLTGTVTGVGGIVLGPGTTLTASAGANAGLSTTPIVLTPTIGTPADLFTGSVHVVGPLDVVNGTTPELIILPGDTLVGVGGVNASVLVQGGGANAPGDGPGTIAVSAPVTDLPGATYSVEIDGPVSSVGCGNVNGCAGEYSSTIVTGAGNAYTAAGTLAPMLTGISAPANNTYIPPVTTSFVIVQAAGGVLGSFSGITQPAPGVVGVSGGLAPGTRFDALYGPSTPTPFVNQNAITLYVAPADYTNLSAFNVGLSGNQEQVGSALNALRGQAGLRNSVAATMDLGALFVQQPAALPRDFDTLSGETNADAVHGAFQMMGTFLELMVDPSVNGRNGSVGSAAIGFAPEDDQTALPLEIASAYDSVMPAPKPTSFDQRWNAWGSTYGGTTNTAGETSIGSHNLTANAYGIAGGMDYHVTPDTLMGFALGGGGTNWNVMQGLGTGRSDAFQAGVYSKTHFGAAYASLALAFANQWMTTDRFAFTGDHLRGTFVAQNYGGRVEAGYRFAMPWAGVAPYAAIQAQDFRSPAYSETDLTGGAMGLFGLNYNAANTTDISGELGARFDSLVPLADGKQLVLRARAAWEHDWVNDPALTATFQTALVPGALPGAPVGFVVNGAGLPQNSVLVSVGADLHLTSSLSVGAKFDSAIAETAQTYAGSATARFSW